MRNSAHRHEQGFNFALPRIFSLQISTPVAAFLFITRILLDPCSFHILVLLQPPGGSYREATAAGNQKPRISLGCTGTGCCSRSCCISRGRFGVPQFRDCFLSFSADDSVRFQHDEEMDAARFRAGLRVLAVDEDRVNLVVLKRVLKVCDYNNGECFFSFPRFLWSRSRG